jgi:DNA-binding MarR family transcriptional regulator
MNETNLVKKFYELDKTATISQLYVLLSIAENEGSRQSKLPPYSMSQATLSRVVMHLTLDLGLVASAPDPTDTRQRILTLTKDGRAFLKGYIPTYLPPKQTKNGWRHYFSRKLVGENV